MKNNIENFYEESIEKWRNARCNGSMLLSKDTDYRPIVLGIIQRIYSKNETYHIVIIVKDFTERNKLIEFLTSTENNENNEEVKSKIESRQLKILSNDFVEKHPYIISNLVIVVNIECITENLIDRFMRNIEYKLCILNSLIEDTNVRILLYKYCPIIPGFNQKEVEHLRLSHPVEEYLVGVDIADDSLKEQLDKCDKYINQTFSIFGSYENVLKARMGDKNLNISASELCNQIAYENGWNEHLDMSIAINVELDKMYNPNALNERACSINDVIRERQNLVSDYIGKLEEVFNIVNQNPSSKIFIINKHGQFANDVVEYINYNHFMPISAGYNDKLSTIKAIDDDGNEILIKSGINKGKCKMLGSKAQCTQNLKKYNDNVYNVLSFSQAPDKTIDADVDVIIITSPLCDTIEEYIYRLSNVRFTSNPLKVYSIYCKNTIEEKQIQNRTQSAKHLIVNKSEINTTFDENFGVIVVD